MVFRRVGSAAKGFDVRGYQASLTEAHLLGRGGDVVSEFWIWKVSTGECTFQAMLNIFPIYVVSIIKKCYISEPTFSCLAPPGLECRRRLKGDWLAGRWLQIVSMADQLRRNGL